MIQLESECNLVNNFFFLREGRLNSKDGKVTISREGEIALNKELEKGTSYSLLGFKFEFEFLNG